MEQFFESITCHTPWLTPLEHMHSTNISCIFMHSCYSSYELLRTSKSRQRLLFSACLPQSKREPSSKSTVIRSSVYPCSIDARRKRGKEEKAPFLTIWLSSNFTTANVSKEFLTLCSFLMVSRWPQFRASEVQQT